jgi:hypothetical protein
LPAIDCHTDRLSHHTFRRPGAREWSGGKRECTSLSLDLPGMRVWHGDCCGAARTMTIAST